MHPHQSDHDHDDLSQSAGEAPGCYEIMETAVRELLVERGMLGPGEIRRQIEVLDSRTPALGAKVVARAWVDPAFKARLLENGRKACEEFGISFYDDTQLIVLENTEKIHNVIVCTLCSCYPRALLGLPPDWIGAESGACRVRHGDTRGRRSARERLNGDGPIPRLAPSSIGHRSADG